MGSGPRRTYPNLTAPNHRPPSAVNHELRSPGLCGFRHVAHFARYRSAVLELCVRWDQVLWQVGHSCQQSTYVSTFFLCLAERVDSPAGAVVPVLCCPASLLGRATIRFFSHYGAVSVIQITRRNTAFAFECAGLRTQQPGKTFDRANRLCGRIWTGRDRFSDRADPRLKSLLVINPNFAETDCRCA
jgi:hypothetical protein